MRHWPLAALLLAGPALAQERPALFPTRDVTVSYRAIGGAAGKPGDASPVSLTVAWQATTRMMRSDVAGVGWMVADQRSGRAFMVMEQMRVIMEVPVQQAMVSHGFSPAATFRREGAATVAGHGCTVWAVEDGADRGRACVTAEGVLLRSEGSFQGQGVGMEATAVSFAPVDPARFQRPEGYQAMPQPGQRRPPR